MKTPEEWAELLLDIHELELTDSWGYKARDKVCEILRELVLELCKRDNK